MTVTKRALRLTVAAAVLSAGAFVAGPATAAPSERVQESATSVGAKASASDGARSGARKIKCRLGIAFKPRVGKRDRRIRTVARTRCNVRVRKIWTTVKLVQTKAPDRHKKTSKRHTRRNRSSIRTFCPREYRRYKIVGRTTIKLPRSAAKKHIKLRRVGHQRGVCRS